MPSPAATRSSSSLLRIATITIIFVTQLSDAFVVLPTTKPIIRHSQQYRIQTEFFSRCQSTSTQLSFFNKNNVEAEESSSSTKEEESSRIILTPEEMEELELKRQEQVAKDKFPYLFLFALQLLPLVNLSGVRVQSIFYFFGVAVTTVYLGGRQVTIAQSESISSENALLAPVFASLSIGVIYTLIQLGFNPSVIYSFAVTIFGALAISDVGVPILRNVIPSIADATIPLPEKLRDEEKDVTSLPLDGVITLLFGLACTVAYWIPSYGMEQKFIISNGLAWAIAMTSLGAISFGSFQTASILLAGLFFYDIFWVFGTDVMMTVATKVEAPVKFIYPSDSTIVRDYPFSVLGLGDIVIPGLFVRFMGKIDEALLPVKLSYLNAATAAYAFGLATCFIANEITHAGQPALLYLSPACIGSALLCGVVNSQLGEVWNFQEPSTETSPSSLVDHKR